MCKRSVIRFAGWLVIVSVAWVGLTACGGGDAVIDVSPVVSVPTRTLAPSTATPTPLPAMTTPTPTDLPAPATLIALADTTAVNPLIPAPAQTLIDMIARDLSTDDSVASDDLRLLSLERFIWRGATWGCNARYNKDEDEAQTDPGPIPGYRIIFMVGTRAYVYHTDHGETFFRCTDRDWLALQGEALPLDPIAESMVEMAVRDAIKRLDSAESDLDLISLLVITWPDASVGCPKPGAEYDDQATAGYRLVLRSKANTADNTDDGTVEPEIDLIYHTSLQHVVRCEPEEEILPGFLRRAVPTPIPAPAVTPET
ncbi:MAG: hypothetical protein JXA10_16560 [Anaerolineae bacterium]|nr:hypothetical protein [Anaerolineae bacterium]